MTTATTHTVSNSTSINTLTCDVCQQLVIVKAGMKNVTCSCCGHTMAVKLFPNLDDYIKGLGVTASGNDTIDINDGVAFALRGLDIEKLYPIVVQILESLPKDKWFSRKMGKNHDLFTGTTEEFFKAKYEHLNEGMQRMNLGNVLRGAFSRSERVA